MLKKACLGIVGCVALMAGSSAVHADSLDLTAGGLNGSFTSSSGIGHIVVNGGNSFTLSDTSFTPHVQLNPAANGSFSLDLNYNISTGVVTTLTIFDATAGKYEVSASTSNLAGDVVVTNTAMTGTGNTWISLPNSTFADPQSTSVMLILDGFDTLTPSNPTAQNVVADADFSGTVAPLPNSVLGAASLLLTCGAFGLLRKRVLR